MKPKIILILEDNPERIKRFQSIIKQGIKKRIQLVVYNNAFEMIKDIENYLSNTILISLDHDLESSENAQKDLGNGRIITQYLSNLPPFCPVIIHTSNIEGSVAMMGDLEISCWHYKRVLPYGEDWIEQNWYETALSLI